MTQFKKKSPTFFFISPSTAKMGEAADSIGGIVGGFSNATACVNSCRIACLAGEQGQTGNDACGAGNDLACWGGRIDDTKDVANDAINLGNNEITLINDIANGFLGITKPFAAGQPKRTLAAPADPAADPGAMSPLFRVLAAQPSDAQAVAAAAHVQEVMAAAHSGYRAVLPLEAYSRARGEGRADKEHAAAVFAGLHGQGRVATLRAALLGLRAQV
jgi:hypothetical protein